MVVERFVPAHIAAGLLQGGFQRINAVGLNPLVSLELQIITYAIGNTTKIITIRIIIIILIQG